MSQSALDALSRIVGDLRSKNSEDTRRRAALDLRELVDITARDLSAERFLEFYALVNTRINQLISHGSDPAEKLGGIYALDALIDFDGVDVAQKTTRFAQSLKAVLRGKDLVPMQPAAAALGKICRPGGSLISELVESEVKTALEWLQSDRVEERRYSAVLVLRELARNAPTLMYAFVGLIFDQIWVGLRDPKFLIRQTSAEAISASFQIIRERDQLMRQTWQSRIYDEAVQGVRQGSVEYIHGSLLVIRELLQQGGMFMHEHYQEVCEIIFRHKDHRDAQIRRTVVMLIPELANYSPTEFAQSYLHKFMVFLSGMLKKDKDRNDAFLAIGNIANAVKSAIAPYLDGVLIYVREGLSLRSRRSGTVDPVFDCISRLAVAVGQTLSKYMEALLDPIFACELTPKLTQALVDMAFYIPPVKSTIQERLLDMLSKVLCGEPFKPLGAPTSNSITAAPSVPKDSKDPLAYEHRQTEIKLALNTLGSFDFSGHVLNEFVRDVAIKYVEDENPDIREAAALTCCQLYVRDPIVNQTSYHALQVVSEVIEKLLTVGVADPDAGIRRTVLAALDERFDRHLGKAENIRTLFFALNDEVFAIREVAITIIGRLTNVNPAYVIPSLRKVLIQMLTELEFSDVARNKEESAKLLSLLVQNSQRLIKPYVDPMISVLLPKARDPNPAVSSTILKAIGDLATVGGEDMVPYINKLMPIIIEALQDQSSIAKREAALRTLGQLASNSGYVIQPYLEYPTLLEILVSEVIEKLLTVGVADPDAGIRRTVLAALDERFDRHLGKAENIRTLFFALNDEVFAIREVAITIIGRLTNVNPAYVIPSLRKVLIQMLTELEFSDVARNKEESAKLLSLLVQNSQRLIKPYVDPMISVLLPKARDPNPAVSSTILKAIGDLATVGGEDMVPYINKLMPIIIEALQDQSSIAKREAALRTLGQLASNSGYVIQPYLEYPTLLEILTTIIRSEPQRGPLRQETIKLMGILGALDPYKHQQVEEKSPESKLRIESTQLTDISLMMTGLTPSSKEYFPTVVINALLQILKDPSLAQHHAVVVEAIMTIFRTLGLECVPFLEKIIPAFLSTIRGAPASRLESYFSQLGILVTIVRQHIRTFLPDIVTVLQEFWNVTPALQANLLQLVEAISKSLEGEFKIYLAGLLPLMLGVLEKDVSTRRLPSERVLHAFLVFGSSAEEYMHLIIPVIVSVFEKPQQPPFIRKSAIETIGKISRQVNLNDYASKIIHPLARVLAGSDITLRVAALDTLCALIFQLGRDYLHFVSTISKVLAANQISHQNYELLVSKLQKGEVLPQDLNADEKFRDPNDDTSFTDISNKKLDSNPVHLKASWDTTGKSTKEDWQEWMRRFSVTVLTESPNHSLRACAPLASVYPPLARELFNSAFVSCWGDLFEPYQDDLIQNIETAIRSPHVTPDLLGILLNLAEFMEHDDKALPIDIRVLGREAGRCHAWAKALHYKELEFLQDQSSGAVEALIQINNQLQQYDAAIGILRKAQLYKEGIQLRETWFEKLERWEEALDFYEKRELEFPDQADTFDVIMGKMRCLHALGEWDSLSALAQKKWHTSNLEIKRAIAPLATAAALGLAQWDLMDDYLSVMKANTPDRSFFGAILALHRNQFRESALYIQKAREGLDTELSALISESYNRAYTVVVRVQMLAELEELIIYKQSNNNPAKQETMRRTWERRTLGCQRNVEVWQRMLKLRALVITPKENMQMNIKFANLCRKSGRMGLAEKNLKMLVGSDESLDAILPYTDADDRPRMGRRNKTIPPQVQYAVLKYHWAAEKQAPALEALKLFTTEMVDRLEAAQSATQGVNGFIDANGMNGNTNMVSNGYVQSGIGPNGVNSATNAKALEDHTKLLARCCLKQGEWQIAQKRGDWQHDHVGEILSSYRAATNYNPKWYKAWHAWALANFEIVQSLGHRPERDTDLVIAPGVLIEYVVPAVRGFFKSIALSEGSSLQDTLRLLTLWFAHGGSNEVNSAVTEGFASVSVDTWLEVIPQLIARINQPNTRVRQTIHNLLADVGRAHPQALVYPLTVAMKSAPNTRRSRSAMQIMDSMRQHSARLVEQADVVSHELIRVAVLWHELWHEGLEEASRLYFGDRNIEGMFTTLAPLHDMLDQGPETLREISFAQTFGRDLQEAREWCATYRQTGDVGDINQAWDLYYQVFRRIARQLPQLNNLELAYVSPKLLNARDLDLAVPGTYQSGKPVIRILNFDTTFSVISSKQRPRKLSLTGSDGMAYAFLLKGHEDIRQDERVMQLFGLCNTLLVGDTESYKRHLNIQRYPAIPLSQNSGLLGWVPNSDTLHVLIREYRESRKILLNIEHRIMLQMAPDYDNLTLMQKVEVFRYALDNTTGQDLYRVLWLKSKSSESWLERRTNYTRSLGVMSMVGYILGLGDRHPSNLMLDRITGKIIHIDFGDCFEVAMHRDKYPERVPFRLTRMLTYAMEVSNIEGSFRITCENVMRVLRDNKESLMAVLEAFIHDPLLNWRLTGDTSPPGPNFRSERRDSIMTGHDRRPSIMDADIPPSALMAQDPTALPGGPPSSRPRARTNSTAQGTGAIEADMQETQNERAVQVLNRVKEKLTGHDFKTDEELTVIAQVNKLLNEATKLENLCQHYIGWCSFW